MRRNVYAVLGLVSVAGNNRARINCVSSGCASSPVPLQLHGRTRSVWNPLRSPMLMLIASISSVLGQASASWPRCSSTPTSDKLARPKNLPFHCWTLCNGEYLCRSRRHGPQRTLWSVQSTQRHSRREVSFPQPHAVPTSLSYSRENSTASIESRSFSYASFCA